MKKRDAGLKSIEEFLPASKQHMDEIVNWIHER